MVGEYPTSTKSGGGYFYDDVLEYRVWCRPRFGAPDKFEGEMYYCAFPTYDEAKNFSKNTQGTEEPLVLVRQLEWVSESEQNKYMHEKGERITEWLVEWLIGSKRNENTVKEFISANSV